MDVRAVLVVCVACGSSAPARISNTAEPAITPRPVTPDCERVAASIARVPGPKDCCGLDGRRGILGRHCTDQAWPRSTLTCADPDEHDVLACPYAAGLNDNQQAAFSALFDRLYGDSCPTDCATMR